MTQQPHFPVGNLGEPVHDIFLDFQKQFLSSFENPSFDEEKSIHKYHTDADLLAALKMYNQKDVSSTARGNIHKYLQQFIKMYDEGLIKLSFQSAVTTLETARRVLQRETPISRHAHFFSRLAQKIALWLTILSRGRFPIFFPSVNLSVISSQIQNKISFVSVSVFKNLNKSERLRAARMAFGNCQGPINLRKKRNFKLIFESLTDVERKKVFGKTEMAQIAQLLKGVMAIPVFPRKGGSKLVEKTLSLTNNFTGYKVSMPDGTGKGVLGFSRRPANFFYDALLKGSNYSATLPGEAFFSFKKDDKKLKYDELLALGAYIREKAKQGGLLTITAKNQGEITVDEETFSAESVYGDKTYELTYAEVAELLGSQKIYLAKGLPLKFYVALKRAMREDNIVEVPRGESILVYSGMHTRAVCKDMLQHPQKYGFTHKKEVEELLHLEFDELAPLIVKAEQFYIFCDGDGKILERKVGEKSAIRLVSFSGIRNCSTATPKQKSLMKRGYATALSMNPGGFSIFPAVGMGVWGGTPELYWRSFFEALLATPLDSLPEVVFVCPGKPAIAEEYKKMFNSYLVQYKDSPEMLAKLNRIVETGSKDIAQFARLLRKEFPTKNIDLVNASDPDVVVGFHTGEYVNGITTDCTTTEENYTAIGTNGIVFEGITGVHEGAGRIVAFE